MEEIEREDNFRLKRFKELKIKKAKGTEDPKIIKDACECVSCESIFESDDEIIEEEDDREIKPAEILDQREKNYEPLNINAKITQRKIDSNAQDMRIAGDTCMNSCLKNTNDIDKTDNSCPLCGNKITSIKKTRTVEFTKLNEDEKDGKNQMILDECCDYKSTDAEDLCPVCEEEIKNVEFYDQKPKETNRISICNESNIKGAEDENLCAICRQNTEKATLKNDKKSCSSDRLSPPCKCKKGVEIEKGRSQDVIDNNLCSACAIKKNETKVKNTCSSDKLKMSESSCKCKKNIEFIDQRNIDLKREDVETNRNVCMKSETADYINRNICSACGAKKNETKIENDDCNSVKSSKSDVSCKCKKSIEFIDQREINRMKSIKDESFCLKSEQSDKVDKNMCSMCGNKKSPKRDNNVCGSSKTSKSEMSCNCKSDKQIKSETSCKCKRSIEFIDQREIDRNTVSEVENVSQTTNEGDNNICSTCRNKKNEKISESSTSNKSSKSEISCKCKSVKPSKPEVVCDCNKENENVNQEEINVKKSIEREVCSTCANKNNQSKSDDSLCGRNKLSNSNSNSSFDQKEVIEEKNVCAVCGNNKNQTSDSKDCEKSKITCNCKKGIEFIDQREVVSRQSSKSENNSRTPKKRDGIDNNVCSVCGKEEIQTKSDKNIYGSTKSSKSNAVCTCKNDIEPSSQSQDDKPCSCKSIVFIDQREIDAKKKGVCKSSTQNEIDKNSQSNICCTTKSTPTVAKNNSGSFKSSKSSASCSCKKNIEFIDQREIEKATKKPKDAQSLNENVCPACNSNKDISKNQSSHSCLSNIQSNASNKCVKTASKSSTKDICLAEKTSSSTYAKENIGKFIKTYKEVIKIKRSPDKDGKICEKIVIIRTKIERQIGTFNSDSKFDKKDKNNKKVKRSKSDNLSRCSSLGSNKVPKKTNSSDLVSITSQSISITSVLSQGPAPCSTNNNTENKICGTSLTSSVNSKSIPKDALLSCKSNKSVDSRYKIKIISKDDVCKSNNYENEIEVTPSTIVILKKILSQSSCKLDKTKLKKSSKEFSCYKPDCSCESISLPCEKTSEPKSLYEKFGEYLSDVNPFKGQAKPSDTKISANQSQSMKCIPIKSDVSCPPKREVSNSRSKFKNKKCLCSKSKSTLNSNAELNCNCKLLTQPLKDECSCLKSIFNSPDATNQTCEHQIDAKDSCSCNRIPSKTSQTSVENSGDYSCGKPKSSCNMPASKSNIENTFTKCVSNKHSSKTTESQSECQTCSKSQENVASGEVTPTKSKCSCETSNSQESRNDCSCTKPQSSLPKANEDCKCNNKRWIPGKRSITRVKEPETPNSSCTASIQNVDSDNFSGVVDIAAQTCALCASSQDNTRSSVQSLSNCLETQSTINNKITQSKEECNCQSKQNKLSEANESRCNCKIKKEKLFKCPCQSANVNVKTCSQNKKASGASKTCSRCGSKISRADKKEPSCSCSKPKSSCESNDSKNKSNQECKCKSKSRCNCSSKKEMLSKCSCKSVKQSSDANSCSRNSEKSTIGRTCSQCGSKLTKTEKQSSCSCRKPGCKCKSKEHTSKCPCNNKKQEPLKCSCKSSKQSLNKTIQNVKTSASQTCSRCGLILKSKDKKLTRSCQQSQSSCSKSVDLSRSKSSNSNKQDSSRCSYTSSKTSTEFETCSQGMETKSVVSQTSEECCPKKDSKEENLKPCSCRKSKCKCKSKKIKLKENCPCQTPKQKLSNSDTNICIHKKDKYNSKQPGCACKQLKQSSINTESNCKCEKETTKATKKSDSSKCPCKSASKQSLNSDICSQSSGTISVASQTSSKRSSDQSRKSLRFSSDISPTRIIKSYSPVSPKGSACSIPSQDSCCSIYSTPPGLSKPQSKTSVASQCSCGKKDASTVTRRSDRYDVRTLRLLTDVSVSKLKCPCHSDSSVVRVRRQNNANNVPKCRSHGDQNYYYRQC